MSHRTVVKPLIRIDNRPMAGDEACAAEACILRIAKARDCRLNSDRKKSRIAHVGVAEAVGQAFDPALLSGLRASMSCRLNRDTF